MQIIRKARRQPAIYWKLIGFDEEAEPMYEPPVDDLLVRWDDIMEIYVTPSGEERTSRAQVMVDRDMPMGSVLMLGTMENVIHPDEPLHEDHPGAFTIRGWKKHPTMKATHFLRIAIM